VTLRYLIIRLYVTSPNKSDIFLTCLKPSPLIGWKLILVKSPQEGPETCHFLLELRARDWLGEIEPGGLVGKDERRVVQEALEDI